VLTLNIFVNINKILILYNENQQNIMINQTQNAYQNMNAPPDE